MISTYEVRCSQLIDDYFKLLGELWVFLAIFETTLRNFFDFALAKIHKRRNWWEVDGLLRFNEMKAITKTRTGAGEMTPINRVSMGFWVTLSSRSYHAKIWKHLIHLYPSLASIGRRGFQHRLLVVRDFRNKLAHHNITLQRNIARDIDYMQQITEVMAPTIARGMKHRAQTLKRILVAEAGFEPTTQRL